MLFAKTNVLILLNLKKYIPNVVFREIFQILFCRHRNCICLEVKLHFAVQADLEQVQEVQDADLHQHAQPDLQVPTAMYLAPFGLIIARCILFL